MKRRTFILAIVAAPAFAQTANAGASALEMGWRSADRALRQRTQTVLSAAGLYFGEINGRWGHGLERALLRAADLVMLASGARVKPELRSLSGAGRFIKDLGHERFSALIATQERTQSGGLSGWIRQTLPLFG